MCTKKIHKIITEDGRVCNFNIRSIPELSRISGVNERVLRKRLERLGKNEEILIDDFLKPLTYMKKFKPRKRCLTIAQQCRQENVKRGTYQRRKENGASHNQALNIDFLLDKRYKLRYLPDKIDFDLCIRKTKLFCYGIKFESFEEIACTFDVNQKRLEGLVRRGLSIEEAIVHRDSKNKGLISFARLERSEKLRNLPAQLYLAIIYIGNKKFIKIGFTTKDINYRLKQISRNYKVIFQAHDILHEVFKSEQFIIEKVLGRGYNSCDLNVDGRSEIFEYSGYLENIIWDTLDLIFGQKIVNNHFDSIL